MEGIALAIDKVAELTRAAKRNPQILPIAQEKKGTYLLIEDDKVTTALAGADWHNETLATPDEMVRFVAASKGKQSAVFYDDAGIIFVYDLGDRRDMASCALRLSPQHQWVLKPAGPMRQQEFIRLLRITLRGCLSPDSNLLGIVRNLKFSAAADGGGNIQHGRESVGRSLQAQVTGESAIPEEVTLMVQTFDNVKVARPIACAIEVNPQDQTLQLTPYPMEARRAMDESLAILAESFEGDGMPPVYRGHP